MERDEMTNEKYEKEEEEGDKRDKSTHINTYTHRALRLKSELTYVDICKDIKKTHTLQAEAMFVSTSDLHQ
jgi:hypothetical protein